MKLKCRIHEKEYDIVSGATFSEEYNETLDSGSIILDHISKIKDLKPYDDVYIWNADENFVGYYNVGDRIPIDVIGGKIETNLTTEKGSDDSWTTQLSDIVFAKNNNVFSLTGFIMNIWSSLVFEGIGQERWKIDKITFKFVLKDSTNPEATSKNGYYKICLSKDDIILQKYLTFEKDTHYQQDSELPALLFVPFQARIPLAGFANSNTDSALLLAEQAVEVIDEGNDGKTWNILNIEKPEGLQNFIFYKNSETKTKINIKIRGITDQEMKTLEAITMKVLVNGTIVELKSNNKFAETSTKITYYFNQFLSFNDEHSFARFKITLKKNNDGTWEGDTNLKVEIANTSTYESYAEFWGDKILSDLTEGAITIISISQQQILPNFFKHFLVDSFTCDMIDLDKENYKYKIDLMSETKRLEKIILPNISITQPIVGNKRTIWYYLNQYVKMYSPKIKVADENNGWVYKDKFKIDERSAFDHGFDDEYLKVPVHEIFDDTIFAPEISLTAPTLREVLSRLMIVKDCIPVVKNDVIYAMKISDTHGKFLTDSSKFSFISESMNSANYSTAFRREYSGAISQKNSTHMVEFLGFRNKGNALMTLDNMYLETRFPIYKINTLYLCYYKAFHVSKSSTGEKYQKLVLIKQDISKLVLQNAVRDALPADWTKLPSGAWSGLTTEEMSKFRLLTLGFDIGSSQITGWGEKYSYISDLLGWTHATYTYIETIVTMLDEKYPYGVGQLQFLGIDEELDQSFSLSWKDLMVTPNSSDNIADKLKSLFFQMDYIGMYSGAIVHSKENTEDDDIQTSDNCSAALSILEVDGLFEKEKANRLGNNEIGFIARFDNVYEMNDEYNDILGATWGENDEIVIFHREYQIYDDCVLCNFLGTRDYVMKNYFTTVFAKYRTYSYASYTESVNRSENDKYLVTLSDDSCLYENNDSTNRMLNLKSILSAFSESVINQDLTIKFNEQVNGGYFTFEDGTSYFSDVSQFMSGYSLCFNIKTFDNITNGNYISTINCYDDGGTYIGSAQGWYKMPVSENDGFLEKMGCYFGHFNDNDILENNVVWDGSKTNQLFSKIFAMPLKNRIPTFSFGKEYNFCKDNKEVINFTLQYELINSDTDLLVSEWLMKLTNFNNYVKFSTEKQVLDETSQKSEFNVYFWSEFVNWNFITFLLGTGGNTFKRAILIRVKQETADNVLRAGQELSNCYSDAYSCYFTNQGDPGTGSTYTSVTCFIHLFKIAEIVRENGEITALKVRAYYERNSLTIGGFVNVATNDAHTLTLTFSKRSSSAEGWYEFYYEGQDAPGFSWEEAISLDNGRGAGNPYTNQGGGVVSSPKYFAFPQTMYVIKSTRKMEQSLIYAQYKPGQLPDYMQTVSVSPSETGNGRTFKDVFDIQEDKYGRPFIQFTANNILGDDYQSVQYWYLDRDGDGYLHFVFGINRTKEQGNAKAYISLIKNRNKKVYNVLHREAGVITNFAQDSKKEQYGKQLYEPKVGD